MPDGEGGNRRESTKSKHMVVKKAIFCSLWLGMDEVSGFWWRNGRDREPSQGLGVEVERLAAPLVWPGVYRAH